MRSNFHDKFQIENWPDCFWRQMMMIYQKTKTSFYLDLKLYSQTLKIEKRWQSILPQCFVWSFKNHVSWWFLAFSPSWNQNISLFHQRLITPQYFGLQNAELNYYFVNFQPSRVLCVWTTTRIDLKFSRDLQSIKIYSRKYSFHIAMFWLKVIAQNSSKLPFFVSK